LISISYEYINYQNHIGGVMVCMLSSKCQRLWNWYLLLLCWTHSIKEKEQRLVGSESGYCVRVGQHVYLQTVVLVN